MLISLLLLSTGLNITLIGVIFGLNFKASRRECWRLGVAAQVAFVVGSMLMAISPLPWIAKW